MVIGKGKGKDKEKERTKARAAAEWAKGTHKAGGRKGRTEVVDRGRGRALQECALGGNGGRQGKSRRGPEGKVRAKGTTCTGKGAKKPCGRRSNRCTASAPASSGWQYTTPTNTTPSPSTT